MLISFDLDWDVELCVFVCGAVWVLDFGTCRSLENSEIYYLFLCSGFFSVEFVGFGWGCRILCFPSWVFLGFGFEDLGRWKTVGFCCLFRPQVRISSGKVSF